MSRLRADAPTAIKSYDADLLGFCEDWTSYELPLTGVPALVGDVLEGQGLEFTTGKRRVAFVAADDGQLDLLLELASLGVRGIVRVPSLVEECARLLDRLRGHISDRNRLVAEMADYMVADEETRVRVVSESERLMLDDLSRKA